MSITVQLFTPQSPPPRPIPDWQVISFADCQFYDIRRPMTDYFNTNTRRGRTQELNQELVRGSAFWLRWGVSGWRIAETEQVSRPTLQHLQRRIPDGHELPDGILYWQGLIRHWIEKSYGDRYMKAYLSLTRFNQSQLATTYSYRINNETRDGFRDLQAVANNIRDRGLVGAKFLVSCQDPEAERQLRHLLHGQQGPFLPAQFRVRRQIM